MMNFLKGKKTIAFLLTLILTLSASTTAFANYYGTGRNFTSNHGGYFFTTIQALDSKWSSTYNTRFILQTIWAASGNDWLEVGFMDGALAEPGNPIGYHRGYYTAIGKGSTYQEYKIIGPSTTIGTNHNFQIQRDGSSSWGVYVDYTLRRTYSDFATVSSGVDVGLETNNTVSTSAQWHNRNFQLYNGTTWSDWTTGSLSNSGVGISVSWNPSYTDINNSKTNPSARSLEGDNIITEDNSDEMYADSVELNTKPEPVLKANIDQLMRNKSLYKATESSVIDKSYLTENNGEVKTTEYMAYGEYIDKFIDSGSTDIDNNRLVLVAQVYYENGFEHPRFGLIENCLSTGIYDVETGMYLGGSYQSLDIDQVK